MWCRFAPVPTLLTHDCARGCWRKSRIADTVSDQKCRPRSVERAAAPLLCVAPNGNSDGPFTLGLSRRAAVAQLFDMHDRRVLGIAFAFIIAGALAVMIWPSRRGRCPLVLNIVSVEPAGIIDDAREEMWLVTLRLSNSDARPSSPQNRLYFKSRGTANRWIGVEGALDCALAPGEWCDRLLLLPARTDACRSASNTRVPPYLSRRNWNGSSNDCRFGSALGCLISFGGG